jgi:hypothetical protein
MHVKVAELVGESKDSWKDAVSTAVGEAAQKLGNITGVEVINMTGKVENGRLTEYKANVKVVYVE